MMTAAPACSRRAWSRSATTLSAVAAAALLAAGAVVATAGAVAAATPNGVTVSPVDTVGYPDVDLVVTGLPGFGLGRPPAVRISQDGAPLRTSTTWELSAENPLAVVVDAPPSGLEGAQGLVAELVQELPPSIPVALTSVSGGAARPGLDRDSLMTALSHQAAHQATTLARGLSRAESAGVQHVVVVTTCTGPAPQPAAAGITVDVLGIGPSCTGSWPGLPGPGAGRFSRATTFATGLSALDAMVARWRSSVVAVTQALTHEPLVLTVGTTRLTLPVGDAGSRASQAATPQAGSGSGAGSSVAAAGGSAGRTALVVGVVLLILGGLLALVWWRRREPPAPPRPAQPASDVHVVSLRQPQMAVAREQLTGHSEVSPPAVVARLQSTEEPLVVAEQTPVSMPSTPEVTAEQAPVEQVTAEQAPDEQVTDEQVTAEQVTAEQAPVEQVADQIEMPMEVPAQAPEVEANAVEVPSADDGGYQVRSEFSWTKLEFAPLVWQYDKEPETVDIRDEADVAEPVTVDVRDQAVHTSRRRKARR
jgi:hypothetical protein